jgi:hypothetical protein
MIDCHAQPESTAAFCDISRASALASRQPVVMGSAPASTTFECAGALPLFASTTFATGPARVLPGVVPSLGRKLLLRSSLAARLETNARAPARATEPPRS